MNAIERLREAADKATPGPWSSWIEGEGDAWGGSPGVNIGERFAEGMCTEDARFIAAADPTTIIAWGAVLLDVDETLMEILAAYEDQLPIGEWDATATGHVARDIAAIAKLKEGS